MLLHMFICVRHVMLVICSGRGRLCAAAAVLVQLQGLALSQRRAAAQGVSNMLVYSKIIHVQLNVFIYPLVTRV